MFFPWQTHRMSSNFLYLEVGLNTSRGLLVSNQLFLWNPLRLLHAARTSNHMMLFGSLGSTSFKKAKTTHKRKDNLTNLFMFKSVQYLSGHNNKPSSVVLKQIYVVSTVTKTIWGGAWQIIGSYWHFLKGHIFDKIFLPKSLMMSTAIRLYCPLQLWHLRQKVTGLDQMSPGGRYSSVSCPCCRLLKGSWKTAVPR